MAMPTLTVMGMYNYDNTLFDEMSIPEGVDRENVINNILMETAELEVIYPNMNVFKMAIHHWSMKQLPVWDKLKATTEYDYNPIHNYDRTETWEDVTNATRSTNGDETTGRNTSGTTESDSTNGGSDTTEQKVSAYDTSSYQPREQNTTDYGQTNHVKGESALDESGTRAYNEDEGRNETVKRTGHAEGNIGVTTTQQMIEAERDVVKFNIIDYIINDFKRRFCILVY